jgi:hypothetical protein
VAGSRQPLPYIPSLKTAGFYGKTDKFTCFFQRALRQTVAQTPTPYPEGLINLSGVFHAQVCY